MSSSDDEEDETVCPLCAEELDLSDKNFLPCPCGYRVCTYVFVTFMYFLVLFVDCFVDCRFVYGAGIEYEKI